MNSVAKRPEILSISTSTKDFSISVGTAKEAK